MHSPRIDPLHSALFPRINSHINSLLSFIKISDIDFNFYNQTVIYYWIIWHMSKCWKAVYLSFNAKWPVLMVFRAIPKYKGLQLQPTKCTNGTFFFEIIIDCYIFWMYIHPKNDPITHTHTQKMFIDGLNHNTKISIYEVWIVSSPHVKG